MYKNHLSAYIENCLIYSLDPLLDQWDNIMHSVLVEGASLSQMKAALDDWASDVENAVEECEKIEHQHLEAKWEALEDIVSDEKFGTEI